MDEEKTCQPEEAGIQKRLSKAAAAGFLLGVVSIPLFFLYWLALIFCLVGLSRIKRSRGQLHGRGLALAGIFVPLILILLFWGTFFFFWFQDADPVPDDYTVADLVQVRPENQRSNGLLMQFWGHERNNNILQLDEEDYQVLFEFGCGFPEPNSIRASLEKIRVHADSIRTIWDKASKGREIFEQLAEFDEIADLAEPTKKADWIYSANLKYVTILHQLHSILIFQEGRHTEAIEDLLRMDKVIRELSRSSRPLVTKLYCYGVLSQNIRYLNLLVNLPETSREDLETLQRYYLPYAAEEVSLKNNFLFEYVLFKNEMQKHPANQFPFFKKNSSYRLYKFHIDCLLLQDRRESKMEKIPYSIWPWENPDFLPITIDTEQILLPWYYDVYNPIGSMMIMILAPAHEAIFRSKDRIVFEMNIFQALLQKRLGEEVDLDRILEENHAHQNMQKGIIYIRKDTCEIQIPIDPEVLGLAE